MNIAIVDDEALFRKRLEERMKRYYCSSGVKVEVFSDGMEFVAALEEGKCFDAVFLDIEMPGMNGLDSAARLREYSEETVLVFVTSHQQYAPKGYEVDAFRYIDKSLSEPEFEKLLSDLTRRMARRRKLLLRCGGQEVVLRPESVIYAASDNNMVRFVTAKEEYSARMKITAAMDLLSGALPVFVRVHRCTVVNLGHIVRYNERELLCDNGCCLTISRSFSEEFRHRMFDYIRSSAR